ERQLRVSYQTTIQLRKENAMTNSTTASARGTNRNYAHPARRPSDVAPMVVTKLSGWIDVGEVKATAPSWIIHTAGEISTELGVRKLSPGLAREVQDSRKFEPRESAQYVGEQYGF
ncbi:MAG: hypothetical protein ACMG6H_07465, partial [Acidobacteriota bacterium]